MMKTLQDDPTYLSEFAKLQGFRSKVRSLQDAVQAAHNQPSMADKSAAAAEAILAGKTPKWDDIVDVKALIRDLAAYQQAVAKQEEKVQEVRRVVSAKMNPVVKQEYLKLVKQAYTDAKALLTSSQACEQWMAEYRRTEYSPDFQQVRSLVDVYELNRWIDQTKFDINHEFKKENEHGHEPRVRGW